MTRKPVLATLMFFQLFAFGALIPMLPHYLTEFLGMSGAETGIILSISVLFSVVSPLLAMAVADRFVSTRNLFLWGHAVGALLIFALSWLRGFWPVLAVYGLHQFIMGPTIGLMNALAFKNLPGGSGTFGDVRVWGTVGWVAAGWVFGGIGWVAGAGSAGTDILPWIFRLSSLGSLGAAVTALTIPSAPRGSATTGIPRTPWLADALRQPAVSLTLALFFVNGVSSRFAMVGTSPFLFAVGIPEAAIAPIITIGQLVEILALAVLTPAIRRFGYRRTILAGGAAEALRHLLFLGSLLIPGLWLLLPALGIHGMIYASFVTCGTMAVDEGLDESNRAGVHQLLNVASLGAGGFVGSLIAGYLLDVGLSTRGGWFVYWGVPALIAAGLALFVAAKRNLFRISARPS